MSAGVVLKSVVGVFFRHWKIFSQFNIYNFIQLTKINLTPARTIGSTSKKYWNFCKLWPGRRKLKEKRARVRNEPQGEKRSKRTKIIPLFMPERYKLRKNLSVWQRAFGLWSILNKQMCDCSRSCNSRKKKPNQTIGNTLMFGMMIAMRSRAHTLPTTTDILAHVKISHWTRMFWHFHPIFVPNVCVHRRSVGSRWVVSFAT